MTVVIFLLLGAQLQRFLQQFRDESVEIGPASSVTADSHSSSQRKDYSGDFRVYYTASLVAKHTTNPRLYYVPTDPFLMLYENVPQDTVWSKIASSAGFPHSMHFIYPPFAALLLEPLSAVKWQSSILIWRVMLVGMVLISLYLSLLFTGVEDLWLKYGLAVAAALSFFPLMETLAEGQIDPLILLCWAGGIYFIKTGRPFWSALLFALGTVVKVSPVIVVGLFLLRRQWKWIFGYALSLIGLTALSVWRLGWDNHVIFARSVLPILSCGIANLANKSLGGFIYDVYLRRVVLETGPPVPGWLCLAIKLIGLSLLAAVLFYFWRRNKTSSTLVHELVTMSLVTLLISPVSWRHHYLLVLIPLVYLWSIAEEKSVIAVLAIATLGIGTVFPDYAITAFRNRVLDIALAGIVPISALLLLWQLCAGDAKKGAFPFVGDQAEGNSKKMTDGSEWVTENH